MYPGGRAGAHGHFPRQTRAHRCLCVCASLEEQQQLWGWGSSWALLAARTCRMCRAGSQLYPAGMCNTGCKSWQAQQFLFGSGYFSVLCLRYNAPFCLVLRHLFLILCWSFALCVCFGFHHLERVSTDQEGATPHFSHWSTVGHSGKFGWVCSAPALCGSSHVCRWQHPQVTPVTRGVRIQ